MYKFSERSGTFGGGNQKSRVSGACLLFKKGCKDSKVSKGDGAPGGGFENFCFWHATRDLTCASCRGCNSATNGTLIGIVAFNTAENELKHQLQYVETC